jgi:hypothetical protein
MVKTGPQENHIIHRANYGMAPLWQMVKFGERPTVSEIESVRAELPEAAEAITALESEER